MTIDSKHTNQAHKGKRFSGTVTSVGMVKTIMVEVIYMKKHPLYKKSLRRTRKFACHNEIPDIHVGDKVEISEVRPISKSKHFTVTKRM